MTKLNLKDKEGYPLTPDQFWASEERCVKLYIEDKFYPAFEKAAYKAYVRFIRVDAVHNEENKPGETKFFTRHTLEADLFRLGQYFEEEKAKMKEVSAQIKHIEILLDEFHNDMAKDFSNIKTLLSKNLLHIKKLSDELKQ